MRTHLLLICFIGAVASETLFTSGKEYEFQYQGKIMSGIPALDSQFAGLVIKSKVIVQALDAQNFKLAMKNVEFKKFNEKLSGPQPMNWRTLETPETNSIPTQFQSILESPIQFSMINGQVSQIKVSENEPTWTLNFKKSLVSLLKIQTSSGGHDLSQNTVRRQGGSLPSVWKTMEQAVDGKCENSYQISEIPEYMLADLSPEVAESRRCEGQKIFQITKSRDVNKCVERAVYQVRQPGQYLCNGGNCDSMWGRSSNTRYIGCGSSPETMDIQLINNDGEIQQNLMGYNTENVVTGTRQILTILEIRSSMTSLPEVQSPRIIDDLLFEYPDNVGLNVGKSQPKNYREQQQHLQNQRPSTQTFQQEIPQEQEYLDEISSANLQKRIIDTLTKIVEFGKQGDNAEKRPLSEMTVTAAKAFSLLSTQQMSDLYEQVKQVTMEEQDKEILRQLVLEVSAMSGTNPSIMFLKNLIEKEEFSPLRVGVTIASIPHYIRAPTVQILDQLFELIKSPVVTRNSLLKNNAELAFATLINKACIDTNRENRFPIYVFGEFCTSKTSEITTKYIPYFVNQLHSAKAGERTGIILALGTMGHESVIPILMPYIEGKAEGSSPLEQRIAVYSLNTVTKQHRDILLPVYSALVHNPSENRNVRIAALSIMMRMDPSMAYFQKLATSTWFEKDNEFQKFVFSTLKTLSEIKVSEQPIYGTLYQNSQKAKMVLHLAKPIPLAITSTLNAFTAEWLKELQVGYQFHGSYTSVSGMQGVYAKLEYVMQKLKFSPLELSVNVQGTSSIWETIQRQLTPGHQGEDKVHSEWKDIASALNIQPRENTPFGVSVWARLFNDMHGVFRMNTGSVDKIMESLQQGRNDPTSWKEAVCGKTSINFVKVQDFAPTEILVPSDMGLPILIEYHMPVGLYARGEVNVDCSKSIPSVSLNLHKKLSTSVTGFVGTICPFTKEIIAVGINQHWSVNYPTKLSMKMELGKLKVVYSPANKQSSGPVDTWSYTVKPFSTIKPLVFVDLTPISCHANTKVISSGVERKTEVFQAGESIGLNVKYQLTSETQLRDRKNLLNTLALYKNNPMNIMMFSWTHSALTIDGKPSCRYHNVKMVLDLSQSTTKEAEIEISTALAIKNKGQQPESLSISIDQQSQNPLQVKYQQLDASNSEHQKIQQVLEKLNVEQGVGLTTKAKITLKGGAPKTFNFILNVGQGQRGMNSKWNLHLENQNNINICVDGSVTYPTTSIRDVSQLQREDIRAAYKNNIGFGQTCEEHKITVTGTSSVSQSQKDRARNSKAAKKCEEASSKVNEIREEIRNSREESQESRRMEQQLVQKVQQKRESCQQQVQDLSTMDEVKVNVRYTTMPEYIRTYSRYADVLVKSYLLPFMSGVERRGNQNEIDVQLKFNPNMQTVDASLSSGEEIIKYRNIRLNMSPYLARVLPLRASQQVQEQVLSSIQMAPVYPTCRVGDGVNKSFDNKTFSYELDDCYHVLASECKQNSNHAVLAKKVNGKLSLKVFTHESKITVSPASSYTESRKEYNIEVDGTRVSMSKNEKKEVESQDGKSHYRLYRSADNVLVLETPYSRVIYDGKDIEILHTALTLDAAHCGLCGNRDGDRRGDIATAQQCQVQNIKAAALSFRVQQQCSQLSEQQKSIKADASKCVSRKVEQSPVSKTLKGNLEKCSQMKHLVVRHADKVCFSQLPIVECGSGCAPRSTVQKQLSFSCLPADRRVTRHYEDRARRGEVIPELRNMEKSSSLVEIPTGCSHPGLQN